MVDLISMDDLKARKHIIIDVRTSEEIAVDPIEGALHIELQTIPSRLDELPADTDTPMTIDCPGNIRSNQAASYLLVRGYENVIVLDKFSV